MTIINFEELKGQNSLGLDYTKTNKEFIKIEDVSVFGVVSDEVKEWNRCLTINFFNKHKERVAEIFLFNHERVELDPVGSVKVLKK